MKWFTLSWWKYLFESPMPIYRSEWRNSENWLECFWLVWGEIKESVIRFRCRARGHKCGVWWYTSNGYEPDMHCKDCGDNLG